LYSGPAEKVVVEENWEGQWKEMDGSWEGEWEGELAGSAK
jgi:hypothetical protein